MSECCPTQVCREALAIAADGMTAMFVNAADNDLSAVPDSYDRMAAPTGFVAKPEPRTPVRNAEAVSIDVFMDSATPTKAAVPTRCAARTESPRHVSGTVVVSTAALMESAPPGLATVPICCDARPEYPKHVDGAAVATSNDEFMSSGTRDSVAPRKEPDATAESHPRDSVTVVNAVDSTDHVDVTALAGRVIKPRGSLNVIRSIVYQCNALYYSVKSDRPA